MAVHNGRDGCEHRRRDGTSPSLLVKGSIGMKTRARVVAVLCAAASAAAIGLATPAAAQPDRADIECSTYRASDGKSVGVSCTSGRYYVVGTACSAGGCTTIGGNIVSAPNISWARAGSGYFGGDIKAVFV